MMGATAQLFGLLLGFWLVLVAPIDLFDAVLGLVVAASATWAARHLVWSGAEDDSPVLTWRQALRLVAYVPFLIIEIVKAAVGVAEKVLDPRLPIDPVVITYRVPFRRTVSLVALANSITLTPGTLTVDLDGSTLTVHALAGEFGDDLLRGGLARQVGHVFEEE